MNFLNSARNKPIIKHINAFQKTAFYPMVFAVLCCVSSLSTSDIYFPTLSILTFFIVFSAIFSDDNKTLLVPMLMIYYALPEDKTNIFSEKKDELLGKFDPENFKRLMIILAVMAIPVLARLILDGSVKRAFCRRGICFWGTMSLNAAFILNGLFSVPYSVTNLVYGVSTALFFTVFSLVVLSMLDASVDPVPYACRALVCTSLCALAQSVAVVFLKYADNIVQYKARWPRPILPWGVSTIVAGVIVVGIPAALYLARSCRFSAISYSCAVLLLLGTVFVNGRAAMLLGFLFFFVGVVLVCAKGKNRIWNIYYTLVFVVLAICTLIYIDHEITPLTELLESLKKLFRFNNILGDVSIKRRFEAWSKGFDNFLSSPLFGTGFSVGRNDAKFNIMSNMYHNVVVQIVASMGIAGIFAAIFHLRNLIELLFRKMTAGKTLLLLVPFMILALSVVDNFIFYLNFQIIYCIFLALAEIELEGIRRARLENHKKCDGTRKPRIVFTYVEAGKGHVVPERTVCRAFAEKYGDEFEVVESRFYTETGDPKLAATEKLFTSTVRLQNKNKIMSLLCNMGNKIFGDTFGLYYLVMLTKSGLRSRRAAMKHMRELDADMIFTTHWSTAFYASRLKNPPYTVMFCPDCYSNGMFNVDVNDFILPTAEGREQTDGRRMYAGGNVITLGSPLSKEAYSLYSSRDELRAELGIARDDFVVILSDGGYGMSHLGTTVEYLLKSDVKLTVIALCGTNEEVYKHLCAIDTPENIRLIPVPFQPSILKYLAVSDLFCGKGGANSISEAAYFGVPVIINRCITYIETGTKNYYKNVIGGALHIPSAKRSAEKIIEFAKHPEILAPYSDGMSRKAGISHTEAFVDLLYARAVDKLGYK